VVKATLQGLSSLVIPTEAVARRRNIAAKAQQRQAAAIEPEEEDEDEEPESDG
jgi:hypothetical protein